MFSSRASVLLAACLLVASHALAGDEPDSGRVVQVHDGDTVTVESGGARYRCRLLGIDAPEMSYARLWAEMDKVSKYAPAGASDELGAAREAFRNWAGVMEGHAREAQRALAGLVADRTVRLGHDTKGPRKDRYGRLLVYVGIGDVDVNAEMIRRGLAVAETRFPCERLQEYVRLWRAAQAAGVGLWSACAEEEAFSTRPPPRDRDKGGGDPVENDGPEGRGREERRVGREDP